MAIIKRNIWALFFLIIFISSIVFTFILYKINDYTYKQYITSQENVSKITSNSIYSILLQYEMILDILGNNLTENNNFNSIENSKIILDKLLKLNTTIDAFGLATPDGQLYVTSSSLQNIERLPNLTLSQETRDTFFLTLQKKEMVLGRTYFHDTLKSLIIPIRKAIRDEKGNVLAVMTAGINVNKSFDVITNKDFRTLIFRDFDYYNQLTEDKKGNLPYASPLPKKHISTLINIAEKKYNTNLENIKNSENAVTIIHNSFVSNKKVVSTLKYIKRYNLWVNEQMDEDIIEDEVFNKIFIGVLIYLFIMIVLYLLFKNIDEYEKKKQKALYHQATHDYLTNLNNRYFLSDKFEVLKTDKPFTLFFIDIDNFKSINDNYGHKYGDIILKEIAFRLTSFKNKKDFLIRYSGDEFILICYITEKESVKEIANGIISRLSEPFFIEQFQFIIGVSIGISQFPLDADNFDEIKRYADIAMYKAKKEKNTYKIFEDNIKHDYLKSSQIENYLKSALQNNEMYLMYQPQVDKFGHLHGVEALVRWENKELGFVPPDKFIKIAELTGTMSSIGHFIIETSINEMKDVQDITKKEFELSINISVKQFMEVDFFMTLFELIDKYQFNKLRITLEVTENVFIEDVTYIIDLLKKLKESGIKISLDDFGTGYSSLSLLKKLPIDELKVDKSFVDDVLIDEVSRNMVESIISIGKKFHLKIVAEGIEELNQKELLESYGCDIFQGYYYSKPLKKDALIEYIKKNS